MYVCFLFFCFFFSNLVLSPPALMLPLTLLAIIATRLFIVDLTRDSITLFGIHFTRGNTLTYWYYITDRPAGTDCCQETSFKTV